MRFYHSRCSRWAKDALKCLTIGTHCTLCARSALPGIDLCDHCRQQFRSLRHVHRDAHVSSLCIGCGFEQLVPPALSSYASPSLLSNKLEPSPESAALATQPSNYCADCAVRAGQFLRRIVAPYRYAYPVDRLIKSVKYRQDRQLSRVLGTLLADAVLTDTACELPDMLVPMPLHPNRFRHRGFNQAADIALWSGKRLGLPVVVNTVNRIVDTGTLVGLTRQERQLRILGAFRAEKAVSGRRVAIVDDVLTTGASARELAREIYDSGAASVELWVLARTSSSRRRS